MSAHEEVRAPESKEKVVSEPDTSDVEKETVRGNT
jgi:hypothetical protein